MHVHVQCKYIRRGKFCTHTHVYVYSANVWSMKWNANEVKIDEVWHLC